MSVSPAYRRPRFWPGDERGCLMIHGFTSSPADLRPLSEHLHRLGLTVQELLLPGHGLTPGEMARCHWRDWQQAVAEELARLAARCSQVWLLGFSMGGILALLTAATQETAGVVSISAPIWPRPWLTRYAFILQPFYRSVKLGEPRPCFYPFWRYQEVATKSIAGLMSLISAGKKSLGQVTVPVLVLQGRDDRTVNPASARYIYNRLGSAKKELRFFPGPHLLLLGENSSDIYRYISQFIMEAKGDKGDSSKTSARS